MTNALGELDLPPDDVARLVAVHYGLEALAVTRLDSELSTVARVDLASGPVVAKFTRYSPEDLAATRWRIAAMQHLDHAGVPVGRTLLDREGAALVVTEAGPDAVLLHLSTWLPGVPLLDVPPSPALLRSVGATAAQVARALSGWPAPPVPLEHPWELVRTLATLGAAVEQVADPATRRLVEEASDRFRRIAPALGRLPRSALHHDLHDSNLLVEPASSRVSGVLDLGDMVVGPRVAELAVAAAYAARNAPDPVAAFLLVAEGWGRTVLLTDEEIAVLSAAGIGRLAVNAAVWAARERSGRGSYARSRSARSAAALAALIGADEALMRSELRARLA